MAHTESPADAARRHHVHPETIRRWVRRGLISAQTTIAGGKYLVDPDEVDRAFAVAAGPPAQLRQRGERRQAV